MVSRAAVHDLYDLRDADASCGGKAVGLSRLIAAGLPVPDGFAISSRVFEGFAREGKVDDSLVEEVTARARALGDRVAVRSSALIEDGATRSAAGLFLSEVPVVVGDVWTAIRAVWRSAMSPHAVAYAKTHEIAIGVVVQRYIEGEPTTIYTRATTFDQTADAHPDLLVQRTGSSTRFARTSDDPAVKLALRGEAVLGVPADVELAGSWIVQARPIVPPKPRTNHTPPPPIVLASLRDDRAWTWDVTHNPDPLSVAQTELVERVDRAGLGGYELRVCAGYLYATRRADPQPFAESPDELIARCRSLEDEAEKILARPAMNFDDALDIYLAFYRLWADELSPRIAQLRAAHDRNPSLRPSSVEATLTACARGDIDFAEVLRRIGALSPTWDVATPTFGERPELLRQAIELVSASRPEQGSTASIAADLAERDDLLFARAQRIVRVALLSLGDQLAIGDDVFWIRFADLAGEPEALRRKAAGARAAAERASKWQMPIVVGGVPAEPGAALRGSGHGPTVIGRVVRFESLARAVLASAGDVIVVRSVTPALAVFAGECAAIVSETGGLLDHGAALARELGITCVVGCRDAWSLLADGDVVRVDGDAGSVTCV